MNERTKQRAKCSSEERRSETCVYRKHKQEHEFIVSELLCNLGLLKLTFYLQHGVAFSHRQVRTHQRLRQRACDAVAFVSSTQDTDEQAEGTDYWCCIFISLFSTPQVINLSKQKYLCFLIGIGNKNRNHDKGLCWTKAGNSLGLRALMQGWPIDAWIRHLFPSLIEFINFRMALKCSQWNFRRWQRIAHPPKKCR